jgi:hypothetical protein
MLVTNVKLENFSCGCVSFIGNRFEIEIPANSTGDDAVLTNIPSEVLAANLAALSAKAPFVAVTILDEEENGIPWPPIPDYAAYTKNNLSGTAAPGVTNDATEGYSKGSKWILVTSTPMEIYECVDATAGAATWLNTSLTLEELKSGAIRVIEVSTAENDILFGSPSPFGTWVKKTLSQAKTILGLGGSVPTPTAENDVIMAAGSPLDWAKKSIAELKTALGIAGNVPAGSAENDFIVAGASPFAWVKKTLAEIKALLHTAPGAIGETTPSTGRFTTLTATSLIGDGSGITGLVAATVFDCENIIEDLSWIPPIAFTWDPGSLADGAGETSAAIVVPGAVLGATAVQCIAPYDLQGITLNAYVNAADSCKARLQNETTGTIDLASGTWLIQARRV